MRHFLFLGDSVTDCARKRAVRYQHTPKALGHGWVSDIAERMTQVKSPQSQPPFTFWNRGFNGYTTAQLANEPERFPQGVPCFDVITLMIGINDVWHPLWKHQPHSINQSLTHFECLIKEVRARANQVVVLEPIALPIGEVTAQWQAPLAELQIGQQALCDIHSVQWQPLQKHLNKASAPSYADYLADGVHPTPLGHQLLAEQWLVNTEIEKFR